MSSIADKIDREENEQLRSIPAQRLIEKLSLLKNRISSAKKRWFWELLQNASDYNNTVNIRLVVSDECVTFYHDGAPFSLRDALNLISPDSNKQDDELHTDNIGKFGTGLVSTHILSSVMDIEGLCIDEENGSYKFTLSLDRSCFMNKQELIKQITQAKECLKDSAQKHELAHGFNTSFSYRLGKPLPELPALSSSDIDLDYLYETLPYTLCFMPKVRSVQIEDNRNQAKIHSFYISRNTQNEREIVFTINTDGASISQSYAYFSTDDVSTVFRFEDDRIIPYPKDLSRIFCGLPLIGTEEIGMPFILNSLKFKPTTEREGVELEPGSNDANRTLFTSSIGLYCQVLDYIAAHKLRDAYNVAKISRKFNGTQISNQQFYNLYLDKYKLHILSHSIVVNGEGTFIPFSSVRLPFKDSKVDVRLFANCKKLNNSCLPAEHDYQAWFDAIDFTIFPNQKYTYEILASEIDAKANIYSFGITSAEATFWLLQCAEYFKECDRYIFSKHKLLPNQSGNLCTINLLYADNNLPTELKDIYNSLFSAKGIKIEDKLLDQEFNRLELMSQEYTLEMLAQNIDDELSSQYSLNQGNTASLSTTLNKLYEWINNSDISKERLAAYFHWYYPKRATLIVDMLTDVQREQALVIAQSGKMEALAELASSGLTDEEYHLLIANIKKLPLALSLLSKTVDDQEFADSSTGDSGEEIVYKDLKMKYPRNSGYEVIWASRDRNEPCYDFEILKNGQTYLYCDAKTTTRGIANADSIPFFMRKSQWEFLEQLDEAIPYVVARVFMKDKGDIKYIKVSKH